MPRGLEKKDDKKETATRARELETDKKISLMRRCDDGTTARSRDRRSHAEDDPRRTDAASGTTARSCDRRSHAEGSLREEQKVSLQSSDDDSSQRAPKMKRSREAQRGQTRSKHFEANSDGSDDQEAMRSRSLTRQDNQRTRKRQQRRGKKACQRLDQDVEQLQQQQQRRGLSWSAERKVEPMTRPKSAPQHPASMAREAVHDSTSRDRAIAELGQKIKALEEEKARSSCEKITEKVENDKAMAKEEEICNSMAIEAVGKAHVSMALEARRTKRAAEILSAMATKASSSTD